MWPHHRRCKGAGCRPDGISDAELIAAVRSGLAKGLSGNRIAAACGYAGAGPFRQRWDRLKSVYKGLPDLPDFREGIDARSRADACVLDLLDHLCGTIDALKREFGRVYVPCVTGNHGRHDRKPRAKNAVVDNYEWVLYQFLARHYAGDDDVHIQVAESTDIVYSVQGRRYLLTHGDQFQGGTGISGPLVPWSLGDARKRSRQQQINDPYDTMIFGHWHQLAWGPGDKWIANGSLKGYDEYASRSNFGFEAPQQALWVTHPQHGITFRMGVRADD